MLATESASASEIYTENSKRRWVNRFAKQGIKLTPAERSRLWRQANREKMRAQKRRYAQRNNIAYKAARKRLRLKQRKKPKYKLTKNLRSRLKKLICKAKTGNFKIGAISGLTGMSAAQLRKWFELQFLEGMSWENYGTFWVVDHRIPCSAFDQQNLWHRKLCWNWQNLQPLENSQNRAKSALIIDPQLPLPLSF